ncbi:MAG: EamA family transporter [Roseovarius pacificus]|nr:EamA family transporter [Roseovarius pacificus]
MRPCPPPCRPSCCCRSPRCSASPSAPPSASFRSLAGFGLVFAVASVMLSEGARRLPSAETALLSTLEVPLAPVLAWAILSESPSPRALCGGALIVFAVVWSQTRKIQSPFSVKAPVAGPPRNGL